MPQQTTQEISKLLKRLELIKNLILLDDLDDIDAHLVKIKAADYTDKSLDDIIDKLENGFISEAIVLIDQYLQSNYGVATYTDPELESLKVEMKILIAQLDELNEEQAEAEKLINEFLVYHNKELGDVIGKILKLKAKTLKEKTKHDKHDKKIEQEYQEAEQEYREYEEQSKEISSHKIYELNEEEQKELKRKYKQASKLCHPDVIDKDAQDMAHAIFAELNEAYKSNDLAKVSAILAKLEKGIFRTGKDGHKDNKEVILAEIAHLRESIRRAEEELNNIKNSDTYTTITGLSDWEEYFGEARENLNAELHRLEEQYGQQ